MVVVDGGPAQLKQIKTKVTKRVKKTDGKPDNIIWDVLVGSTLLNVYLTPSGETANFSRWLAAATPPKRGHSLGVPTPAKPAPSKSALARVEYLLILSASVFLTNWQFEVCASGIAALRFIRIHDETAAQYLAQRQVADIKNAPSAC